jgi:hypothetical protein
MDLSETKQFKSAKGHCDWRPQPGVQPGSHSSGGHQDLPATRDAAHGQHIRRVRGVIAEFAVQSRRHLRPRLPDVPPAELNVGQRPAALTWAPGHLPPWQRSECAWPNGKVVLPRPGILRVTTAVGLVTLRRHGRSVL